ESNWVPSTVLHLLHQGSSHCKTSRVHFHLSWPIWLPKHQDWLLHKHLMQKIQRFQHKCGLLMRPPYKAGVLPCEIIERASNPGKTIDEAAVEVGEPQERANVSEIFGGRLVANCFYLY
ncbi:hypothetical protein BDV98DRAFT_510190, partial [Pterulicium gracile]